MRYILIYVLGLAPQNSFLFFHYLKALESTSTIDVIVQVTGIAFKCILTVDLLFQFHLILIKKYPPTLSFSFDFSPRAAQSNKLGQYYFFMCSQSLIQILWVPWTLFTQHSHVFKCQYSVLHFGKREPNEKRNTLLPTPKNKTAEQTLPIYPWPKIFEWFTDTFISCRTSWNKIQNEKYFLLIWRINNKRYIFYVQRYAAFFNELLVCTK